MGRWPGEPAFNAHRPPYLNGVAPLEIETPSATFPAPSEAAPSSMAMYSRKSLKIQIGELPVIAMNQRYTFLTGDELVADFLGDLVAGPANPKFDVGGVIMETIGLVIKSGVF